MTAYYTNALAAAWQHEQHGFKFRYLAQKKEGSETQHYLRALPAGIKALKLDDPYPAYYIDAGSKLLLQPQLGDLVRITRGVVMVIENMKIAHDDPHYVSLSYITAVWMHDPDNKVIERNSVSFIWPNGR